VNVRDASNSLDFSWVDEIEGLHLLDDGAQELYFASTVRRCTSFLDLEKMN
jgi:hypothetical protein